MPKRLEDAFLAMSLVTTLAVAASSESRTWLVQADGSGDASTISGWHRQPDMEQKATRHHKRSLRLG